MPTALRIGSYRFHHYSDEGNEPPHIHISFGNNECKFWLDPIKLARNRGIKPKNLRIIEKLVYEHQELLLRKYNEFHEFK